MTGEQLLTLLMSRLGGKTEPTLRAICLLEMQLVQEAALEGGQTLPWFLVESGASLVTVASQRNVAFPADFIREVDAEKPVYYVPDDVSKDYIELQKMSYQEAVEHYGIRAEGPPEVYALRGDAMAIFPLANAVYTLSLDYYKRQSAPSDNAIENNWMKWASDLLLAYTGEVVALQHLEDMELGLTFSALKQTAIKRLADQDTAREEANRDRRAG